MKLLQMVVFQSKQTKTNHAIGSLFNFSSATYFLLLPHSRRKINFSGANHTLNYIMLNVTILKGGGAREGD